MIVEDDDDIRESLQEALEAEGYPVHVAANGREGLTLLAHIERPCVILLDLMMPVMNGWEFLSVQRQDRAFAQIPVIVVSAAPETALPRDSAAVVPKPVDLDQLLEVVRKLCRRGDAS
jgi:CheY-like chemotaxis protein